MLAAPLAWLLSDPEAREAVAEELYERHPDLHFTRGWAGAPDDVQDEFRSTVSDSLDALIRFAQKRVKA